MLALEKAIQTCDAEFTSQNLQKHLKHKAQGQSKSQYGTAAKLLSESPIGGDIGGYRRSDGREVRYNKQTSEYVVFKGDVVMTYYKLRPQQLKRILQGEKY